MRLAGFLGPAGLGLILIMSSAMSGAVAQSGLARFQGAWLSGSVDCEEVYSSAGKGVSFKRPVDIFAPAFIVTGSRLRTPQATCRIKSARPNGDRQLLVLDCANSVAGSEVRVLMSLQPDGSLRRYFNERDTTGTEYKQCSR
ncbi:hypothetical protein HPT29_014890 [Microvirga terrae]|uniref:DUF3617 family protein n=1 Tax=Microvirga terrae TaxID=2740529 RepID=A0ABY5RPT4_9HYPH|nr:MULTISPECIES: hypothetical protein [Microvirga]MBQ0821737.1 hypothetical protein [Microvirga sp. HBU67558]UVF17812.1 hypothetical protein HPT29_014890 [Microvirga terrae]